MDGFGAGCNGKGLKQRKNKHAAQTIGLNMLRNYLNLWSHLSILNMLIGENGL